MNIKTKIASAAMAAVMAVGFTACSQNYTWVAKSGDLEIAPGVYMANLLGAYSNALTLVSDTEKDVLEQNGDDVAQCICSVYSLMKNDRIAWEKLKRANRKTCTEKYSLNRMVKSYVAVWEM